jgi:hypothetical protein
MDGDNGFWSYVYRPCHFLHAQAAALAGLDARLRFEICLSRVAQILRRVDSDHAFALLMPALVSLTWIIVATMNE